MSDVINDMKSGEKGVILNEEYDNQVTETIQVI